MLKLIHAFDMNYENVLEYYKSFKENNYDDIESFSIKQVVYGELKYIEHLMNYEKELYFLVDEKDENYIIGFGLINDSNILDCHKFYDIGNIGYGIRPNQRNKGYATILLKLLLKICEEKGMSEVCVSCNKDNLASKKVILKNNGILEKEFFDEFEGRGLKYWIKLNPKIKNRLIRKINIIKNK